MSKMLKVKPIFPLSLEIDYDNGEKRLFNMARYCKSEFFKELTNWEYFKQVIIKNHTISWPNEQDVAPETVLIDSKKI